MSQPGDKTPDKSGEANLAGIVISYRDLLAMHIISHAQSHSGIMEQEILDQLMPPVDIRNLRKLPAQELRRRELANAINDPRYLGDRMEFLDFVTINQAAKTQQTAESITQNGCTQGCAYVQYLVQIIFGNALEEKGNGQFAATPSVIQAMEVMGYDVKFKIMSIPGQGKLGVFDITGGRSKLWKDCHSLDPDIAAEAAGRKIQR